MTGKRKCKISEAQFTYRLDGIDEEIGRRYEENDATLRELEQYVNTEILQTEMEQAGMEPIAGEVENYLRLLRDNDVRTKDRREAEQRLTEEGVDLEQVQEHFVSYQTINSHLTDCLGVKTREKEEITLDKAKDTIDRLRSRVMAVTERTIDRLMNAGKLYISEADVYVTVNVTCDECGYTYDISELLSRGKCNCEVPEDFSFESPPE